MKVQISLLILVISLIGLFLPTVSLAKGLDSFRYDKNKIIERKNLTDAYARFGKTYKPFSSDQSNLEPKLASQLQKIFSLTDMAVIEKVLLLEFIGKIHQEEISRSTPYRDYYQEIISEMNSLDLKDKRLIKIRKDLLEGINYHREVLDTWLEAARRNRVDRVQNANSRWVHYGTSTGDKIFYQLYHNFIKKNFKEELPENLEAISRHLYVLVF